MGLVKLRPYALIAVATWWLLLCLPMKEGEKALGREVLHRYIRCVGTTAQGFAGGGFFGIAVEIAEEQAVRPISTLCPSGYRPALEGECSSSCGSGPRPVLRHGAKEGDRRRRGECRPRELRL